MHKTNQSRILFSERLSSGIMVHFADGISVLLLAEFLYNQRTVPPNKLFQTDKPASAGGASKTIRRVRSL